MAGAKLGNGVVFMHQGLVREVGVPEEIFRKPATPELRPFLGMAA